jgi:hypothetical protein
MTPLVLFAAVSILLLAGLFVDRPRRRAVRVRRDE